eukprot:10793489-Alexandrium_andersonii.AAC.1
MKHNTGRGWPGRGHRVPLAAAGVGGSCMSRCRLAARCHALPSPPFGAGLAAWAALALLIALVAVFCMEGACSFG